MDLSNYLLMKTSNSCRVQQYASVVFFYVCVCVYKATNSTYVEKKKERENKNNRDEYIYFVVSSNIQLANKWSANHIIL